MERVNKRFRLGLASSGELLDDADASLSALESFENRDDTSPPAAEKWHTGMPLPHGVSYYSNALEVVFRGVHGRVESGWLAVRGGT